MNLIYSQPSVTTNRNSQYPSDRHSASNTLPGTSLKVLPASPILAKHYS